MFGDAIDEDGSGDEHQELDSTISLLNSDVEYKESKIESSGSKVENTGSSLRHAVGSWGSIIPLLVCVGSLLFNEPCERECILRAPLWTLLLSRL